MKPVRVVPIGAVDRSLLDAVASAVERELAVPTSVALTALDPSRAFHPERRQYHSTELLHDLAALQLPLRVLGVTSVDLYIPILTFVFGEAQVGGDAAIVSYHRLHQDFYGLPPDPELTRDRLIKGAIHELGHTYGLAHCDDYECVMAASHAVEWLDMKGSRFCDSCATPALRDASRGVSHHY